MAIAFDASSGGFSGATTSLTISHTCTGSNRLLLVSFLTNNTTDLVTGVTYNGVAMMKLKQQGDTVNSFQMYTYGLLAPATGANNVVISFSSSSVCYAANNSYTGVSQTILPDATSGGQASGTTWGNSITTVADNAWHHVAVRNQGSFVVSVGGTARQITSNIMATADSNAAITPAGSHTLSGTCTDSGANQEISVSFAPTGAEGNFFNFFGPQPQV